MSGEIGGYFELELGKVDNMPCQHGAWVNSGRNALEYILRGIGTDKIRRVYLPSYTCPVVLEPFERTGIRELVRYEIDNNLEIRDLPELKLDEYLVVNNYFGIKDQYIDRLVKLYGDRLIIDNSQALYHKLPQGVKAFYSPRKFVGVPDGGIALPVYGIGLGRDESYDRCSHLLKRMDTGASSGYEDFHVNSEKLKGLALAGMSALTHRLLESIDFEMVRERRQRNYTIMRNALEENNLMATPEVEEMACPMVYPYRTGDNGLKAKLISEKVYVARYWPGIGQVGDGSANILADQILPLPIDQRYDADDMARIIEIIKHSWSVALPAVR